MLSIILSPEAENDVFNAYEWYEKQCSGLGSEFILCIDAEMHSIKRNPKICQTIHKKIRRSVIRRFPYCIFYIEEPDHIRVLSVFHAHKNPSTWKRRK